MEATPTASRSIAAPLLSGVVALGLAAALVLAGRPTPRSIADRQHKVGGSGAVTAPGLESRQTKSTEGLLRQTAEHLSKMQGGASTGGFPGFEPPDDDKEYRDKIKNERYSARDVNDWVRQINNFLNQIVKKNPGLSLEEILQRRGSSQAEIDGFIEALQGTHNTARVLSEYGVNPETVKILESLMKTLRVPVWSY